MKFISKIYIIVAFSAIPLLSLAKTSMEKYHEDIAEMSVDANISSPDIPKKYIETATARMSELCTQLKNSGFDADAKERGGLVVTVTIPAIDLFAPNDTLVAPRAVKPLMALARHLKVPDYYKVLVTVHSDDTGTEEYLNQLTRSRADAIVEWFGNYEIDVEGIVPYGMGFDEPLSVEPTRAARALNRRIEIYFVPGPQMIDNIKAGR